MLGSPDQIIVDMTRKTRPSEYAPEATIRLPHILIFALRVKHEWVRIGAKDFVKYLAKITKIDFITKAKQFIPGI